MKHRENQRNAVYAAMYQGYWRTLAELAEHVGDPTQSVSARLRDLRKMEYGRHRVDRRQRAGAPEGVHEYRLTVRRT